ncbi:hypothetical protein ACFODL_01765 [Phenylobacterium terrae]|uniref:DUF4175 domain-containing protein n=1 Tax=Phenylobacterium terrae TaxID=2665495 RepID=A0ABW4MXA9_9CAUL
MSRPEKPKRAHEIFFAPAVLALVSLVGLVFALLVDGPADALAWAPIGAPIAVIAWAWVARRTWPAGRGKQG